MKLLIPHEITSGMELKHKMGLVNLYFSDEGYWFIYEWLKTSSNTTYKIEDILLNFKEYTTLEDYIEHELLNWSGLFDSIEEIKKQISDLKYKIYELPNGHIMVCNNSDIKFTHKNYK